MWYYLKLHLKVCDGRSLSVCRLLHQQMEQSLSDAQCRLSVKMNELQAAHKQIENLEIRIGERLLHPPTQPPAPEPLPP